MSQTPKKPAHLFVVKEGGSSSTGRGRVIGLESLSPSQAEIVARNQKLVSVSGVLVGVLAGEKEWDLRPLILERGVITISRFLSPSMLSSEIRRSELKGYVSEIPFISPTSPSPTWRESDGAMWVTRTYYNLVIQDEGFLERPLNRSEAAIQLIRELEKFHQKGRIHGHLTPANIAVDGNNLVIVDPFFHLFDSDGYGTTESSAPEVRSGKKPSAASDIFGLGLVLRRVLREEASSDQQRMIDAMIASEPSLRPTFLQIVDAFIPRGAGTATVQTNIAPPTVAETASKVLETPSQPVSVQQIPAQESSKEVRANSHSRQNWLITLLGALVVVLLFKEQILQFGASLMTRSRGTDAPYEVYWRSNQPSLMQQVARAAIDGDSIAELTIIDSVSSGEKNTLIQGALIKKAFNPAWEASLTPEDRALVLKLALSSILPSELKQIPPLADAHPGVLLAVISEMSIEPASKQLVDIPIDKFISLPVPFGSAYEALSKLGITNMGDPSAQSLAHILTGDTSERTISAWIGTNEEVPFTLAKLEILIPLLDAVSGLDEALYKGFVEHSDASGKIFGWFSMDEFAKWSDVSAKDKMLLFAGTLPKRELTFEQKADLLKFPRAGIRERAKAMILEGGLPESMAPVLAYLTSKDSQLTRTQTISLLAALGLKADAAFGFVSQWFDTEPQPESVLQILLRRQTADAIDPFNLEAARYLANHEWKASVPDLDLLTHHPEPLARALAYSHLDVAKPEERAIIERMAKSETNERMKSQLQERLSTPQ